MCVLSINHYYILTLPQVYFILSRNPDPYPPDFTDYINSVASKIGAESTWSMTNDDVYSNFAATGKPTCSYRYEVCLIVQIGDWMRNSRPDLETVINAGVCFLCDQSMCLPRIRYLSRFERLSMSVTL